MFISFYTNDPIYAKHSIGLIESLEKFNLRYDINRLPSNPAISWNQQTKYKPQFILNKINQHTSPVVWIDIDARVKQYPEILFSLNCDIGLSLRNVDNCDLVNEEKIRINTALMYLNNTSDVKQFVSKWNEVCKQSINQKHDQDILREIFPNIKSKLCIKQLPRNYCYIFDTDRKISEKEGRIDSPVIEQLQASRHRRRIDILKQYTKNSLSNRVVAYIRPVIQKDYPITYKSIHNVLKEIEAKISLYIEDVSLAIITGAYGTANMFKRQCIQRNIQVLHVQDGFLPGSTIYDIHGLWGDSCLIDTMPDVISKYTDKKYQTWAEKYSRYLVSNNSSRRLQPPIEKHSEIDKPFIFLPMQFMRDASIKLFGGMSYEDFAQKIASFCENNDLILAVKKHPHAYYREIDRVESLFKNLRQTYGETFMEVDGSIHWFCQNCIYMVSMTSASVVDGFVNECLSFECGQTIFTNSGAIVHDNNIHRGMQKCLNITKIEKQNIIKRQKSVLYYLYNIYMPLEVDIHNSELTNEEKILSQLNYP